MCGIGALLDPGCTWQPGAAERMVEALRPRGPDGEALRRIGPLALARTRLAIIDVAGGDQPLDCEDIIPRRGRGLWRSIAAAAPTTRRSCSACSSSPSGTAPS